MLVGKLFLEAEFSDTPCAQAIVAAIPLDASLNEWGDEFYFEISISGPLDETATIQVKTGDIGFWPPGNTLAIFFCRTPMSTGSDPVPISEVNLVGRIIGDATLLKGCKGANAIRICF